jgi:large subunit ribosomal protein L31
MSRRISTKKELFVDIWSSNNPLYTRSQNISDSKGRVEKFQKKYNLSEITDKNT